MKNEISIDLLLNIHFAGRIVRKDLTKRLKEGANVPVYVLEYLLLDVQVFKFLFKTKIVVTVSDKKTPDFVCNKIHHSVQGWPATT